MILGPTASLDFQDEGKGEINQSKFFRKNLDLFANVRPARTYPGAASKVGQFDRRCQVGEGGWRGSLLGMTSSNPNRGFRYPAEVIQHAGSLYH